MPRVPLYEQGQVRPQASQVPEFGFGVRDTQAVYAPADQIFSAVEKSGSTILNIGLKEIERADDIAVTEATTRLLNTKNDLFWNPETGAMRTQRKDALDAPNRYGADFKKAYGEIEAGLKSDLQKKKFREQALKIETDFRDVLERHAFREGVEFEKETFESGLQSLQTDAVLNYQDPGKVQANIFLQEEMLSDYAAKNGIDPNSDVYKNLMLQTKSKTHSSVLARMIDNGEAREASEYFKIAKERGEIAPDDLRKIEDVVRSGSVRNSAQGIVNRVFAENLRGQAAIDKIKELSGDDIEVKSEAMTAYRNETAMIDYAVKLEQDKLYEDAYDVLLRSNGLEEIPQSILMKMSAAQAASIQAHRSRFLKREDVSTDLNAYAKIIEKMSNPNERSKMTKADILSNDKLSYSDQRKLIDDLFQAQKGNINPLSYTEAESKAITQAAKDLGLNDEESRLFWATTKGAINFAASENNGALSFDQMNEIVRKQATKQIIDRRPAIVPDVKKYPFQIAPSDIDVDDIPSDVRLQIESALKKYGKPINQENMRNGYQWYLRGGASGQ